MTVEPQTPDKAQDSVMSLVEAAEELGVHYMTAYRYVRTGRMPASKESGQWWVDRVALEDFRTEAAPRPGRSAASASDLGDTSLSRYAKRLSRRAVSGDDAGAWAIVNEALASGAQPSQIHLNVITPALAEIGEKWSQGELSINQEHQATMVVQRIVGQMTPLFRRPGRTRMTIVLAAVAGDPHGLPCTLMADLLTERGFAAVNLGANSPTSSVQEAVEESDGAVGVGLVGSLSDVDHAMEMTARTLRSKYPEVPILLGGSSGARVGPTLTSIDGGFAWATSGEDAIKHFESFRSAKSPA